MRRVLMVAGAEHVHSVVFRQVQYLRKSKQYTFSGFGFGKPQGRPGHADPGELFDRFDPWPGPASQPRDLKSRVQLLPHVAHGLLARNAARESRTWKERALDSATNRLSHSRFQRFVGNYDLYHWHCFAPERLPFLSHFPRGARVIVTLWGTDLYRTAGIWEYARQFEACRHTTVFTMATPEMQTTFLAKFGQQWAEKVRLLNYGACNLDKIEAARHARAQVLRELGIPVDKIIVSVGNSAVAANQHIPVLEAISKLDSELLRKLAIVLPMTYGADPEYVRKVHSITAQSATSITVLDRFLSDEAVSALRCAADIAVHVPISDQFSASMCEALFAGSVLITGAWLPYNQLRSSRVAFHEIGAVPEITQKLNQVLANLELERARAGQNAKPIWEMMAWENVTPKWLALYDEILKT